MSAAELSAAVNVLALAIACAAGLYSWRTRQRHADNARVDALAAEIGDIKRRLDQAASREDMHAMAACMGKMEGEVKVLVERIGGISTQIGDIKTVVSRQEEHLLRPKG